MGAGRSKAMARALGFKHCTFWKANRSPSCRAVMMALDSINLSSTEVDVTLDKGEHRAPEIAVINPLQTLPILKDRELVLHDSHAICAYLVSRYSNSSRLLPKDPAGRAIVDQILHYNSSILYPRFRAATIMAAPMRIKNLSVQEAILEGGPILPQRSKNIKTIT